MYIIFFWLAPFLVIFAKDVPRSRWPHPYRHCSWCFDKQGVYIYIIFFWLAPFLLSFAKDVPRTRWPHACNPCSWCFDKQWIWWRKNSLSSCSFWRLCPICSRAGRYPIWQRSYNCWGAEHYHEEVVHSRNKCRQSGYGELYQLHVHDRVTGTAGKQY